MKAINSVEEYMASLDVERRKALQAFRELVSAAAPKAAETVKYGIPTLEWNGNLVHFAAAKQHIGFYPAPSAIVAFKTELAKYKQSKGAVQFPYDQPIPKTLIRQMVKFRIEENKLKAAAKKK